VSKEPGAVHYEVPVEVDDAGRVTKTTHFDMRTIVKKYVDTWQVEAFKDDKLLNTEEVE